MKTRELGFGFKNWASGFGVTVQRQGGAVGRGRVDVLRRHFAPAGGFGARGQVDAQLLHRKTLVSLNLRLKDLIGPVTRAKKKKKTPGGQM